MADIPKVAVVMGSDSDLDTMRETVDVLDEFGLEYDVRVISAHRTPDMAHRFSARAEKSGFGVIIAAAGGAAHLAGVLASKTILPIIGVPIQTSALGGHDSLLSTVQMPAGIPVATVAIGQAGARNAAILAAQILASGRPVLAERLRAYKREMAAKVAAKDRRVRASFRGKP